MSMAERTASANDRRRSRLLEDSLAALRNIVVIGGILGGLVWLHLAAPPPRAPATAIVPSAAQPADGPGPAEPSPSARSDRS